MAKPLSQLNVIPFPRAAIIQFPKSQLCGCGCGLLLNIDDHEFIISEETGQWYVDEVDFLKAVKAERRGGCIRFLDSPEYLYTVDGFYGEMKAYWMNSYEPIA